MTHPQVTVTPTQHFGQPAMKGIATESIADTYLADGEEQLLRDHILTRHELLIALWYEGEHGAQRHRRRWRKWARSAAAFLWAPTRYDLNGIPMPPRKDSP